MKKGFTLIELLTVISIIGVLSSVVLSSLTSAKNRARDTAVRQQVVEYMKALDMYKEDNGGTLPYPGEGEFCLGTYLPDGCLISGTLSTNQGMNNILAKYIPTAPGDNWATSIPDISSASGISYACPVSDGSTCSEGYIRWVEKDGSGECGNLNLGTETWSMSHPPLSGSICYMSFISNSY